MGLINASRYTTVFRNEISNLTLGNFRNDLLYPIKPPLNDVDDRISNDKGFENDKLRIENVLSSLIISEGKSCAFFRSYQELSKVTTRVSFSWTSEGII